MSEFHEADARLSQMHGYAPGVIEIRVNGKIEAYQCPACLVVYERADGHPTCLARLEAKLDMLIVWLLPEESDRTALAAHNNILDVTTQAKS